MQLMESGNQYLFSIPYTPKTKHCLKFNDAKAFKVLRFNAIGKVSKENYKKYFLYACKKEEFRKAKNHTQQ